MEHNYDKPVSTSGKCQKGDLMQLIINNPTPGASNLPATASGAPNNAAPSNFWIQTASPVISYLTYDSAGDQVVVNVTQPGHPLFPGYVVRVIKPGPGGALTVHNYGEGWGFKQSIFDPLFANSINNVWTSQTQDLINQCGCSH